MKHTEAAAKASLPPNAGLVIDVANGRFKCISAGLRFKSFSWTVRSVPAAFEMIYNTAWEHHALRTGEPAPRNASTVAAELYGGLEGNFP